MAALDRHDVDKAIYNALANAAPVTALIGNPPRVDFYIPPDVAFPFVRVDHIPIGPWLSTMKVGGINWIDRQRYQFSAFSQSTSLDEVSAIIKAFDDVMEAIPGDANAALTGGTFGSALKGITVTNYDAADGTSTGITEFTFSFEAD